MEIRHLLKTDFQVTFEINFRPTFFLVLFVSRRHLTNVSMYLHKLNLCFHTKDN